MKYAFRTRQGFLATNPAKVNQDAYIINTNLGGASLFSVCDGHGVNG